MQKSNNRLKNIFRMENIRRGVQIVAFLTFLYFFLLTVGLYDPASKSVALKSRAPIDTFFRIDPLLGATTMLATRSVIWVMLIYALPVVLLTILAGRFFCGWICPLGTALDATDKIFFRNRAKSKHEDKQKSGASRLRNLKYYILIIVLAAAVFSAQAAYFLDPITIITRGFTFAIYPIAQDVSNQIASTDFARYNARFLAENPYFPKDVDYFFRFNFLAAVMLVGIFAASAISRRFWCRNLCPLGAMLGILSKVSIIRRSVDSKCVNCKKCAPNCKMGAISEDSPTAYQAPECVYCYSCTNSCPTLSTYIVPTIKSEGYNSKLDLNRRRTIQALGVGAAIALLGNTNAAAKVSKAGKTKVSSNTLIRPPGSLPEEEFVDRCVRCSECMKVCPTNGLQPSLTEAGLEGLWTPILVPRMGECSENCNLCSQVCPSQAIQPFEVKEKKHIYIGRAVIDRSQCIAWNSDKQCLVCDEHCSYHALYWENVDGVRRPFVDEHKCVGCGICENACPIQPTAAIQVFSFGDQRHVSRAEQKRFFEQAIERKKAKPDNPYGL